MEKPMKIYVQLDAVEYQKVVDLAAKEERSISNMGRIIFAEALKNYKDD